MAENESNQKKCAHPSCSCAVSGNSKYCSEYCEDAKDLMEIGCGCEHPSCR